MSSIKHPQFILAADAAFFKNGSFETSGLSRFSATLFLQDVQSSLVVAQRARLEKDEQYRQLLPYVIIRKASTTPNEFIYYPYQRLNGVGEEKLAGMVSIGYGGHIDLNDIIVDSNSVIDLRQTIFDATERELDEEVVLNGTPPLIRTEFDKNIQFDNTFIVDSSVEVNKFHAGIIMTNTIASYRNIDTKEKELKFLQPMTAKELLESGLPLESWTEIYLRAQMII